MDKFKVSAWLEHIPQPFREILAQGPPASRLTYKAAKAHLRNYVGAGKSFVLLAKQGPHPMQIGVVEEGKGKKGKRKGEDKTLPTQPPMRPPTTEATTRSSKLCQLWLKGQCRFC